MLLEPKKGISANQIKRTIGVGYKTAWYLCHRIRSAIAQPDPNPLRGIVEVDETILSGRTKGMGRGFRSNKTVVVGILRRGGSIRLKKIEHADRATLHSFIRRHAADDVQAIYTGEWPAYDNLSDHDTQHKTVNHSAEEWVRGDVQTNGIESVWSLLKRSIVGAFHKVSPKRLDGYLDELEWRFDNRKNEFMFRDTLAKLVQSEALPFEKLTSKTSQ